MTEDEHIKDIINFVIDAGDRAEELRLPPGSQVRAKLNTLGCFQAAYTSPAWTQKKHDAMDKATLKARPPYTVLSHTDGMMMITDGTKRFVVTPRFWELA
jgi:hypothetical protein